MEAQDCNGNTLVDGDTVQVTKDLKVKGMGKTLKRGSTIKNIRTTGNPGQIECRIGKSTIVLKTEFMKKV